MKEYDYSAPGAYFITICTKDRDCLFGDIANGQMALNDAGRMIDKWWLELMNEFEYIELDEYIIMPNHFHGLIVIVGAPLVGALVRVKSRAGTRPAPTLGEIIGVFKSITTHQYTLNVTNNNWPRFNGRLWQRNYYERVIRNDGELNAVREYIRNNPLNWALDKENPENISL